MPNKAPWMWRWVCNWGLTAEAEHPFLHFFRGGSPFTRIHPLSSSLSFMQTKRCCTSDVCSKRQKSWKKEGGAHVTFFCHLLIFCLCLLLFGQSLVNERGLQFPTFSAAAMADEGDTLSLTIHHARDIANICIYGKQDVYAKFAFSDSTHGPAFATQPVRGGGKNPVFNQSFHIPLPAGTASVLKCEIWMLSCAKNYMEDQLLGFALVPLAEIGNGEITKDYTLTSTELFHSPAGAVCLSLMLQHQGGSLHTSASSMLVDSGENHNLSPADYSKIEFPDLHDVSENQQVISVYFNVTPDDPNSDSETYDVGKKQGPYGDADISDFGSLSQDEDQTSKASSLLQSLSYTGPTLCRRFVDPVANSGHEIANDEEQTSNITTASTCAATSVFPSNGSDVAAMEHSSSASPENDTKVEEKGMTVNEKVEEDGELMMPSVSINLETPEPIVQQQIVDMYMKSMQHFTESLAKMKLPLDIDPDHQAKAINAKSDAEATDIGNKKGNKIFYGSRAFF